MKPLDRINTTWSSDLAYLVGLMVTDGNLSKDGRHLNFTSKDLPQVKTVKNILEIDNKIAMKTRSTEKMKKYHYLQFGDVIFYRFLLSIGLMPNKSKVIKEIDVPKRYYFDFLRGHFDGDGSFYSYWDKRWKYSFMYYLVFMSASKKHIQWLADKNSQYAKVKGHFNHTAGTSVYQIRYSKKESLILLRLIYKNESKHFLKRKKLKVIKALAIMDEVL